MTDAENSDDERYTNDSFENESDIEVPQVSDVENESTENSDEDDNNLPSVKINTGPIKRISYPNNFASINKTDVVPFYSSSEEEDEVIVGQTLAEINTSSMIFEDGSPKSTSQPGSVDEETKESSEEISEEEENDEEEELRKIKDMEERYLQQISAKTKTTNIIHTESQVAVNESKAEDESEEEEKYVFEEEPPLAYEGENSEENLSGDKSFKASCSCGSQESIDQSKLTQLIQSSLMKLNISSSNNNEVNLAEFCEASLMNEFKTHANEATNIIDPEKIALAVVTALKSAGLNNLKDKATQNGEKVIMEFEEGNTDVNKPTNELNNNNNCSERNKSEIVPYKDNFEEGRNNEIEVIQNNNNYDDDDCYIYYDANITSKTPTSFNSEDYIFHANFIKQIHPTSSTDKLRPKPYPRKSMSFTNERMREIERHNRILLRKILAKKPMYTPKSKSSQSSLEKLPSQTHTRLTTSAVNRKKQQRQIDLDNQVLKRKIESIALRRRPFIA